MSESTESSGEGEKGDPSYGGKATAGARQQGKGQTRACKAAKVGGDRRAGTQLPGSSAAHARGESEVDRQAEGLTMHMVAKLEEDAARAALQAEEWEESQQVRAQIAAREANERVMLAPVITHDERRLAAAVEAAQGGYEHMQYRDMRTLLALAGWDSQGNRQALLQRLEEKDPAFLGPKKRG